MKATGIIAATVFLSIGLAAGERGTEFKFLAWTVGFSQIGAESAGGTQAADPDGS